MQKGKRYLYLCLGLTPTLQREWGGLSVQGKSIKSSKEPFFCPSQQPLSALPLRGQDSWLLLSVQVEGAGREGETIMEWAEGKRHLPASINSAQPLAASSGEALSSFHLCGEE